MRKIVLLIFFILFASADDAYKDLSLEDAIGILKEKNIEVSIAQMDIKIKEFESKIAQGYSYGSLDIVQSIMRSNDAGNVFGFKLSSREASFADFGFAEFLAPMGEVLEGINANPGGLPAGFTNGMGSILDIEPKDLNYPDARNYFQTKLQYMAPLYTGGKLEQYEKITKALIHLSSLDEKKVLSQKIYELKKSYQDMALLESFITNLNIVKANIEKLENMAQNMVMEGYAKKVDVLEVQSKKANVVRMLNTSQANKELLYHFLSFLLDKTVTSIQTAPIKELEVGKVSKEDIQNNLDILKVLKAKEITSMAIKVQEASFKPEAGFFAQYSSSDNSLFGDFLDHDGYTVGVQIKFNLYNGGIDSAALQKARIEDMKLSRQIALAKNGIWLQVSKIKTEIKSLDFDIDSLEKELELSRAIYENYLGRYQEKLVSINDVIIKQSLQIEQILKLKEVQNKKSDKVFELQKILNGDNI
jgi:outer membrane protein TolC